MLVSPLPLVLTFTSVPPALKSERTPKSITSFTGDRIRLLVPDTVNVDTGLIYNPEEPERSYTGIKFTIPFN